MQWYGASPFVLGLRLDKTPWYPPQPQQDYLLFVLYGDLVITLSYYWSCEGISCKAGRAPSFLPTALQAFTSEQFTSIGLPIYSIYGL